MRTKLSLFLLCCCHTALATVSVAENASVPATAPSGFGFEMLLAKLTSLEYHFIEKQLQSEERITTLSTRIDSLVKSVENLAWIAQQTAKTVTLLGLSDEHAQQNFTVLQRDVTELLAKQHHLVTKEQLGEYLLKRNATCSMAPALPLSGDKQSAVYPSCGKVPFAASGVYQIRPEYPFKEPITVRCDQEYESGGWVVIQQRFDGSINFYRAWDEYYEGFGNLNGEFWLGLGLIHQLTESAPHELAILLEDFEGNRTVARYERFAIGNVGQKFALLVIDGYSGTAGDSLSDLKGMPFTTKDEDRDASTENCAVTYTGAWWYRACHQSNLNGKYLRGETKEFATSMVWKSFRGYHYSLKSSKMMIRPKLMT
ncbi:microfibril-associated glycoprotein 4-like [Anopheles merus]|uniref:microfibril-associated glycoprotein 4-like n=1 Tax=Anopheles merus TaxID=30066 RepID=UPI001BE44A36|nr:microfibril-associated glycoprotein 4-like [Anopheles merus]